MKKAVLSYVAVPVTVFNWNDGEKLTEEWGWGQRKRGVGMQGGPAKRGRCSHPKTEEAEGGSRHRNRENGSGLPTWWMPTISMVENVSRCWENQRNPEPVRAGPEPDREGKRDRVSGVEWGMKGESAAQES